MPSPVSLLSEEQKPHAISVKGLKGPFRFEKNIGRAPAFFKGHSHHLTHRGIKEVAVTEKQNPQRMESGSG